MEERNKKVLWISLAVLLLLIIVIVLFFLFWPRYEVKFDTKGGSEIESVMVRWRGKVLRPEDPVREGYTFAGWYYEDEEFDFDMAITKDMLIEAEWDEEKVEVDGISLNATELTLAPEGTAQLNPILSPENAKEVELVWETSDESIVTVDQEGNVKAVKEGKAVITVKTADEKFSATCTIIVSREVVAVNGVEISGDKEVTVGNTIKLTAKVTPENATNKQVTWKSSDKRIATVDQNGVVNGKKIGTVTITVVTVDGEKVATYKITVKKAEEAKKPETNPQPEQQPQPESKPETKPEPEQQPESKPEITPPTPQEPSKSEDNTVKVTGVEISGTTHEIYEGKTTKLTAKVNPSNATNKQVTWNSSNKDVATVDQDGTVRGLKAGTVTITVKTADGGYTATYEVTVKANKVDATGIKITGAKEVNVGDTIQLKAEVTPSNASNKTVTWSSSSDQIATVDGNGRVKGISEGTVTITAKVGNVTATYEVTVKSVYKITFKANETDIEGAIYDYTIQVTKDGKAFTGYATITYNGNTKPFKTSQKVSAKIINRAVETATINITDQKHVTANVEYK